MPHDLVFVPEGTLGQRDGQVFFARMFLFFFVATAACGRPAARPPFPSTSTRKVSILSLARELYFFLFSPSPTVFHALPTTFPTDFSEVSSNSRQPGPP